MLDVIAALRRYWWIVGSCVLLGLAGGFAAVSVTVPRFASSAQVLVMALPSRSGLQVGEDYLESRSRALVSISTGDAFRNAVASASDSSASTNARYDVSVVNQTSLIVVQATDSSAAGARSTADQVANLIVDRADSLASSVSGAGSQAEVVASAVTPAVPDSPNKVTYVGLGLVAGAVFGMGGAVLILRSSENARRSRTRAVRATRPTTS